MPSVRSMSMSMSMSGRDALGHVNAPRSAYDY
jgi:hypothetical protein